MSSILWAVNDFIARILVLAYPGLIVFWVILHGRIDHWRRVGARKAYATAFAPWPFLTVLLALESDRLFAARWMMPSAVIVVGFVALGWALLTGYQASRIIPHRTLIGLAEIEPARNPQAMLATGIYTRTRNPVYFTHFLVILYSSMTSGYVASWALVLSVLAGDALMIRLEERELKARYGAEFERYMRAVPRFVPRRPW